MSESSSRAALLSRLEGNSSISGTLSMTLGAAAIAVGALGFQVVSGRTLGADAFTPVGVSWTVIFFAYTVLLIPAEQVITRRLTLSRVSWDRSLSAARPILIALLAAVLGSAAFVAATLDRFFDGNPAYILVVATAVFSRGVLAAGRGFLAGSRRFTAYGLATGMDGILLLLAAAAVAFVTPTALAFVAILIITPVFVLLLKPFAEDDRGNHIEEIAADSGAFLGALVLATTASQIVLLGGPIIVGLVGGASSAVSIYFVTFTLFRGPVTSSYNLIARVLPSFTELAARGQSRELSQWASRMGIAGVATTAGFGLGGYLLGPSIVRLLYGSEFEPGNVVAALGAAAVGSALVGLFISQIYVARGQGIKMAVIWAIAIAAAGSVLFATSSEPLLRVATAFFVGEVVATLLLATVAVSQRSSDDTASIEAA